jgi:hypothetical protein
MLVRGKTKFILIGICQLGAETIEYLKIAEVESGDIMPPVAVVVKEREQYCLGMKKYIRELKKMPKADATEIARENLEQSGIIDKDGNLTARYQTSLRK